MISICFEIKTKCNFCGNPLPINALVNDAFCSTCNKTNELNNELSLGYNTIFNQTRHGAKYPAYFRPNSSITITYEPSTELTSASEINLVWSTDGWTTLKNSPLNKLGDLWWGQITPSELIYGFSFGFVGNNKTDFTGRESWTILQNYGKKGHVDFPRIIEVAKTPMLRFGFLTTESYTSVTTDVRGWVKIDENRHICLSKAGFMELNLTELDLGTGSYDITVYIWTKDFEPIIVSKTITLFYPESQPSETTTSDKAGIRFTLWVIISLLAANSYKNKKSK